MQKLYLAGWWRMISKVHQLKLSTILWAIPLLAFVPSIIGIVLINRQDFAWASNLCWAVFGSIVIIYFWHFFVEIPSLMFKEKNERLEPFLNLEANQGPSLGNYLSCFFHEIDYFPDKKILEVIVILLNRSVFPVSNRDLYSIEAQLANEALAMPRNIVPQDIWAGETTPYHFLFQIDSDIAAKVKGYVERGEFIKFSMSLDWGFHSEQCGDTHLRTNLSNEHLLIMVKGN